MSMPRRSFTNRSKDRVMFSALLTTSSSILCDWPSRIHGWDCPFHRYHGISKSMAPDRLLSRSRRVFYLFESSAGNNVLYLVLLSQPLCGHPYPMDPPGDLGSAWLGTAHSIKRLHVQCSTASGRDRPKERICYKRHQRQRDVVVLIRGGLPDATGDRGHDHDHPIQAR